MDEINENEIEVRDVSDILEVFGKYQVIQFSLLFVPMVFTTMININYVFVAGDVNYRCRVPECEDDKSTAEFPNWWPDATIDRCLRPVLNQDLDNMTCSHSSFNKTVEVCADWIYESNDTVVAELNLACQPWKVNAVGTIHNIGLLVTTIVCGWMSDRFGRKFTMVICATGSCIGLLKIVATSWHAYVGIEFLESCVAGGAYVSTMVMMLEITGTKKRLLSGILFSYFIDFGETIFTCIAMLTPHWKNIIGIINGPCILFICYVFLIHESPRWAVVNGKIEKAKEILLQIAKVNKIDINRKALQDLNADDLKNKFYIKKDIAKETFLTVFRSKTLILRLLVSVVCRFTVSFVYYGLMLNSVRLPGNKYVNFLLSSLMALPGELISLVLMNRYGRKVPLIFGYLICGVLCVISAYVPNTHTWFKIALLLCSKMVISPCFTGTVTYTMELFPTSVRGFLLGIGSFACRLGSIVAPLTHILNSVSDTLPPIFFGASAVLSSGLLSLAPETKDLPLLETVHQVDESSRKASELKTLVP